MSKVPTFFLRLESLKVLFAVKGRKAEKADLIVQLGEPSNLFDQSWKFELLY